MRVDPRRCDRCGHEYDANVRGEKEELEVVPQYGAPKLDLCVPCSDGVTLYIRNRWDVVPPVDEPEQPSTADRLDEVESKLTNLTEAVGLGLLASRQVAYAVRDQSRLLNTYGFVP